MVRKSIWMMLAALVVSGCGQAVMVRRDLNGGILGLQGDRGKAMEDAHQQMATHCRGPYTIVSEENAVVGSETKAVGQEQYARNATLNVNTATTTNVTEYRVTYQCGAVPPPAPYPPPAAAGPAPGGYPVPPQGGGYPVPPQGGGYPVPPQGPGYPVSPK